MACQRIRTAYGLFLLVILVPFVASCPQELGCSCGVEESSDLVDSLYSSDSSYSERSYSLAGSDALYREVNCRNVGLATPVSAARIPEDTRNLDLSENRITVLRGDDFENLSFLQKLNLSGNQISHIESQAFKGLDGLEELDLSRNRLRSFNNSMFIGLESVKVLNLSHNEIATIAEASFERLRSLEKIDFQSQNLICDCNFKWIVKWRKDFKVKIISNTVCNYPQSLRGTPVQKLKRSTMGCNSPDPDYPIFQLKPSEDQVVIVGDPVTLECRASIMDDSQHFTWSRNGDVLSNPSPTFTIEERTLLEEQVSVSTITLEIDASSSGRIWEVTCQIISSRGSDNERSVKLMILDGSTGYCEHSMTIDNKGEFEWSGLVAGASAEVDCPHGAGHLYSGPQGLAKANRHCGTSGKWEEPLTGQCAFADPTTQVLQKYALMDFWNETAALQVANHVEIQTVDAATFKDPTAIGFVGILMEKFSQFTTPEIGEKMMNIASNLMYAKPSLLNESQRQDRSCKKIVRAIEKFANEVQSDSTQFYKSPNIAIQIFKVKASSFVGMTCATFIPNIGERDEYDEQHFKCVAGNITGSRMSNNHTTVEAAIQLPSNLFTHLTMASGISSETHDESTPLPDFKLQFLVYKNSRLFPLVQNEGNDGMIEQVGSSVISSNIAGFKLTNLSEPVVLTFYHSLEPEVFKDLRPAYWDFNAEDGQGDWRYDGCEMVETMTDVAVMKCNHLTNFALVQLVDPNRQLFVPIWSADLLHPSIYIATFIFTLLMLLVLSSYLCCYRTIRVKAKGKHTLLNICLCLLVLALVFGGGINRTQPELCCQIVGMLLHYFSMCCLLWLAISARILMKALYKRDQPDLPPGEQPPPPRPIIRFYFVGWGVPMIIVGITAAASSNLGNYGGEEFCWIADFTISLASFFCVCALIILVIIIMFIVITCRISAYNSTHKSTAQLYEVPATNTVPATIPAHSDHFGSNITVNSRHTNLNPNPRMNPHLSVSTQLNMNSNANPSASVLQSQESLSSVASWVLDRENTHTKQLRSHIFLFLGFLGLWTLGSMIVIQRDMTSLIFIYVYSCLLVVLGLFIFVNYCALRNDVLIRWKRLCCCCAKKDSYAVAVTALNNTPVSHVNGHVITRRPSVGSVDSNLTNRSNNTNHSNPTSYRSGSHLTSHCNYVPTQLHTGTDASVDSSTQDTLPKPYSTTDRQRNGGSGHRYNKSRNRKNYRYSRNSRHSRDFSDGGTLPESHARSHMPSNSLPTVSLQSRSQSNEFVTALVVGDARHRMEKRGSPYLTDCSQSGAPTGSISKALDKIHCNNSHNGSMSSIDRRSSSKATPNYISNSPVPPPNYISNSPVPPPNYISNSPVPPNVLGSLSVPTYQQYSLREEVILNQHHDRRPVHATLPEEQPLLANTQTQQVKQPPPSYEEVVDKQFTEGSALIQPNQPIVTLIGGPEPSSLDSSNKQLSVDIPSSGEFGVAAAGSLLSVASEKKETSV